MEIILNWSIKRNTLSCGFMDNRRRSMEKRVDRHSCPHAFPQPWQEAGYPQAPQLLRLLSASLYNERKWKRQRNLFCKSNFLSEFANLKSSVAKTKAELTFSIQVLQLLLISVNGFPLSPWKFLCTSHPFEDSSRFLKQIPFSAWTIGISRSLQN